MPELVVESVTSANRLRHALSPGDADAHGTLDGDHLTVDDRDTAAELVDTYPNVRWADDAPDTAVDTTVPRGEVDASPG